MPLPLGTATQMPREVPDAHALRFMPLALPSNTQKRPLGMRGARFCPCGMLHGQISGICLSAEDCEMPLGTATQMPREVPDAHALRLMPLVLPSNTQKQPLGMRGARFLLFRLCGGQCSPLCAAHVKQHA